MAVTVRPTDLVTVVTLEAEIRLGFGESQSTDEPVRLVTARTVAARKGLVWNCNVR
jgi:hypothetical protein